MYVNRIVNEINTICEVSEKSLNNSNAQCWNVES